ncbi:MAG: glycosyltransferase, partial [Alphaproteobacteria bacterium]
GWLVEPSNAEKLAKKIIEVFNLPQNKKDSLGDNARRRIQQKFSLENMLNKTMSVYEELLTTKENINN